LEAPFREIYQDGIDQNLFPPLAESTFASFFTGTATHLVQDHLNDGPTLDHACIDQTFEMLWAAYTTEAPGSDAS
jgi:hypothetical protein